MVVTSVPRDSLLGAVREANGQAPLITADDLMAMADMHGMYAQDLVDLSRMAPEERGPLDEDLDAFVRTFRTQSDLRLFECLEGASSEEMRVNAQLKAERAALAKKTSMRSGLVGLGVTLATGALCAALQSPALGVGAIVGLGATVWSFANFTDAKEDQRSADESLGRLDFWEARLECTVGA